jgi:hypothetical protein
MGVAGPVGERVEGGGGAGEVGRLFGGGAAAGESGAQAQHRRKPVEWHSIRCPFRDWPAPADHGRWQRVPESERLF